MKQHLVLLIGIAVGFVAGPIRGEQERTATVRPPDNGAELTNPGMGWVFHYYDNIPAQYGSKLAPFDTLDGWPSLSVIYLRIPWSYIEPEEGHVRLVGPRYARPAMDCQGEAGRLPHHGERILDPMGHAEMGPRTPGPRATISSRARVSKRADRSGSRTSTILYFFASSTVSWRRWPLGTTATPRWRSSTSARWASGAKGTHGRALNGRSLPATVKRHIDLHKKHFHRTLLVANDDMGGPQATGPSEVMQYAVEQGLTLRDDSILVQPGAECLLPCRMGATLLAQDAGDLGIRALWRLEGAGLLAGRAPLPEGDRGLPRQLCLDSLVAA